MIKVDSSGRVRLRNRKFLRSYTPAQARRPTITIHHHHIPSKPVSYANLDQPEEPQHDDMSNNDNTPTRQLNESTPKMAIQMPTIPEQNISLPDTALQPSPCKDAPSNPLILQKEQPVSQHSPPTQPAAQPVRTTRSGRRIKAPDWYGSRL